MRWARKLWRARGMQRHNPTVGADERSYGTTTGATDIVLTEDVRRKQISLAIRYVATARAR